MPLKGTPQETWTWKQSVAWIGFDISDPIDGNVYDWGVLSSQTDEEKARQVSEKAMRAIVELVGAVCDGSIKVSDTPFPERRSRFRLSPFDPRTLSASEQASICRSLHRRISGGGIHPLATIPDEYSFFWGARFSRDDVLRGWPDTITDGVKVPIDWYEQVKVWFVEKYVPAHVDDKPCPTRVNSYNAARKKFPGWPISRDDVWRDDIWKNRAPDEWTRRGPK